MLCKHIMSQSTSRTIGFLTQCLANDTASLQCFSHIRRETTWADRIWPDAVLCACWDWWCKCHECQPAALDLCTQRDLQLLHHRCHPQQSALVHSLCSLCWPVNWRAQGRGESSVLIEMTVPVLHPLIASSHAEQLCQSVIDSVSNSLLCTSAEALSLKSKDMQQI